MRYNTHILFLCFLLSAIYSWGQEKKTFTLQVVVIDDTSKIMLANATVHYQSEKDSVPLKYQQDSTSFISIELKAGLTYEIYASNVGYYDSPFEVLHLTSDTIIVLKLQAYTLPRGCGTMGLHFQTGSSTLDSSDITVLFYLDSTLKNYPSIIIELGGHTSNLNRKEKQNKALSLQRAEYIKNFLVQRGIESERIIVKGYGSSEPTIHCERRKRCSAEEHSFNDRVSIRILRTK